MNDARPPGPAGTHCEVVYVVDNGRDYSDHNVRFVRVPEDRRAEFEAAVAAMAAVQTYGKETIVGVLAEIEWRDKDAMTPLDWYLDDVKQRTSWETE
jgi:hypothetical protein